MALKKNPAAEWDHGRWLVTTVEVEGDTANLHVRQGMLDEVPDIVSRAATCTPFSARSNRSGGTRASTSAS